LAFNSININNQNILSEAGAGQEGKTCYKSSRTICIVSCKTCNAVWHRIPQAKFYILRSYQRWSELCNTSMHTL